MATIVLVHGGWHGGWCWARTAPYLRAAGHEVFAPTLTGLGERSHLVHAEITPQDHVTDIANVLRFNELEGVVLVGHSYGGFIISGVAAQMAERLSALVYVDAFVPEYSGQSSEDTAPPGRRELTASMTVNGLVAPYGFERWARSEDDRAWLKKLTTPHPARCFREGVEVTGREAEVAQKLYVLCSAHQPSPFWEARDRVQGRPGWRCVEIDCLHDAMVDEPEALARHILTVC